MGSASRGDSERVEVIDSMRGVAALAVVLYHYIGFIPLMGISVGVVGSVVVAATRYGSLGVPVFFVLSGYVIAMTASRYRFTSVTGGRFILRRLLRIAPPYWAMVIIIAFAITAGRSAGYFKTITVTPGQVAAHLAYAQELLSLPPLDVAYWTLCLEVQFYLVFAASAVALHACGVRARSVWFTALTAGSLLIDFFGLVPQAFFPRLWYQFGVGVLTFYSSQDRSARLDLAALLSILLGLGVYRSHAADFTVVAAAGLLLFRNRSFTIVPARLRVLLALGRISYSLYLVHGFIGIALSVWFRSGNNRSEIASWGAIAAATTAACAFAAAFYYVCERQAVKWSRNVRVGPRQERAMISAGEALPDHSKGQPTSPLE